MADVQCQHQEFISNVSDAREITKVNSSLPGITHLPDF